MPEIVYGPNKDPYGYRQLTIQLPSNLLPNSATTTEGSGTSGSGSGTVSITDPNQLQAFEKIKQNLREKYKILVNQAKDYTAQYHDILRVNMQGYEYNPETRVRGPALPNIASGENLEVILDTAKFIPEMVTGLIGVTPGETRSISVVFPERPSGPGKAMSGKSAIFDFEILSVSKQTLPTWDEAFPSRIREGLTLRELETEIVTAISAEDTQKYQNQRNEYAINQLLNITSITQLPPNLLEEEYLARYEQMIQDFQQQNSLTNEQLQQFQSQENFLKYQKLSEKTVTKTVSLGLVFRDIADKEKITVPSQEINDQLELMKLQFQQQQKMKRKQQAAAAAVSSSSSSTPPPPVDEPEPSLDIPAAIQEIHNNLLKEKVFNYLYSHAKIETLPPTVPPTTTNK
jgi:FKBP-type peptidyl-prolyl cis-trans isomerase (trigger factor)